MNPDDGQDIAYFDDMLSFDEADDPLRGLQALLSKGGRRGSRPADESDDESEMTRVDWKAVEARLDSHPQEAGKVFDSDCGSYPLHRIMDLAQEDHPQPPLEVVRKTVRAYPDALAIVTERGKTPLSKAMMIEDERLDIIELLLQNDTTAVKILDQMGLAPIHVVNSVGKLKLLLRYCPDCVERRTSEGKIPLLLHLHHTKKPHLDVVKLFLDAGWERGMEGGGVFVEDNNLVLGWSTSALGEAHDKYLLFMGHSENPYFDAMSLVFKASYSAKVGLDGINYDNPTLGCVLGSGHGEHGNLALVILECRPEEVGLVNHRGRTPLHIFSASGENHIDSMKILKTLLDSKEGRACAARQDSEGRFPLCLAVDSGMEDELIIEIAEAEKRVVGARDKATGLYPFMLAAIQGNVPMTYYLLREVPDLIVPASKEQSRGRVLEDAISQDANV